MFFALGFTESEQRTAVGGGYMYDKMKLVGGRETTRPKPIIKNTNLVSCNFPYTNDRS